MIADEFDITMDDGAAVHAYRWMPQGQPRAIVQIAHGMAEHGRRYARLAGVLVDQGYGVWAHDHRGHGRTVASLQDLGHFADEGGFDRLVSDLLAVREHIDRDRVPTQAHKVGLFAHSMGTFVTQAALALHPPTRWDAVILSGSDAPGGARISALRTVAAIERVRQGKRGRSSLIDRLVFGAYNSTFKPTRTPSDWLSRDPAEVDLFVADPLTGFRLTNQSWLDFLSTRRRVGKVGFGDTTPKDLPILLMAGDRDPVGRSGAGVQELATQLRSAGMTNTQVQLFPGARHELINEMNRDAVYRDTIAFLSTALP